MTKWADYCISAVRYDDDEKHIEQVKVCADYVDNLGVSSTWKRESVITKIENGYSFVTIYKKSDEKWYKGEDVRIIEINYKKYTRTDKNSTAADNLGNLPRF